MRLWEWLTRSKKKISLSLCDFGDLALDTSYLLVAINAAINLIAKSMAQSEFVIYKDNKPSRQDNYYLFNIEPNLNQNASEFWIEYTSKLLWDNEVLVIQTKDNQLIIADSFDKNEKVLKNSTFFNIQKGDMEFIKEYSSKDVFYTTLNNKNIRQLIERLYSSYGKMITKGIEDYNKQRGIKGKFKLGSMTSQQYKELEELQEYIKNKFKPYIESVNGILPLQEGEEFTESNNSGQNSFIDIEEVKKGIDGAFDLVSIAFNIPKGIMKGDLAEAKEQRHNFLTFCLDPIAQMTQQEVNRKYFGKEGFIKGNYLQVDTSRVEHVNIFDVASSLDVLTRISWSRNELNEILGKPRINESWADKHYMTKNYMDTEGGDKIEK